MSYDRREADRRYNQSAGGRVRKQRYRSSEKGQETRRRYSTSDKAKVVRKRWRDSGDNRVHETLRNTQRVRQVSLEARERRLGGEAL